jgi:exo-beta-1,3-glucanase (GH17 family)
MAKHWGLLRLYGSTGSADSILQVIREDRLDLKVLLGVWIDAEERRDSTGAAVEAFPEAVAANRRETEAAVRLAAEYPASVVAISVGNETQIDWSSHRVPQELLVAFIREVRARTQVPVTTADDYNFWNKPGSEPVAAELDFVMTHFHPLWNGIQIEGALDWSKRIYADVRAAHPGRTVVIGETGWATQKHDAGEQATLIKGRPGEAEQKIFHDELTAWVDAGRIPAFWFEAFDENWKGGPSPDDVEKHWGLYRADRTPKPAMAGKPAR